MVFNRLKHLNRLALQITMGLAIIGSASCIFLKPKVAQAIPENYSSIEIINPNDETPQESMELIPIDISLETGNINLNKQPKNREQATSKIQTILNNSSPSQPLPPGANYSTPAQVKPNLRENQRVAENPQTTDLIAQETSNLTENQTSVVNSELTETETNGSETTLTENSTTPESNQLNQPLETEPSETVADVLSNQRSDENRELQGIPETNPEILDDTQLEPLDIEQDPQETTEPETETPTPEEIKQSWLNSGLQSITSTTKKYPNITDPTDGLTFNPQNFRPDQQENYVNLDIRIAENNPVLNQFSFATFPKEEQFYWLLDGNRIVIETYGLLGGTFFQGRSTNTVYTQSVLSEQRFLGLQAVWSLPEVPQELANNSEEDQLTIFAVGGQVITPEGIPAGPVVINTGINTNDPNTTSLDIPNLGSASTNSPTGGGALFQNLDPEDAPKFLQAFPTNNLQPLLNNGVSLAIGQIIPLENLEAAGIGFKDPITGEGFEFSAPITSYPGIQIGQPGGGMSWGLLNSVVNPFLSPRQRELAYLDSLFWIPLGQKTLANITVQESQDSDDWYRFYVSIPHKKTLLEYDPEEVTLNYQSNFSNPGLSLTFAFNSDSIVDKNQIINGSLGLIMGGFMSLIKQDQITTSLQDARQASENGEMFGMLKTAATPQQRRQLNQRLNQNLANSNQATALEQISGSYTFPSAISLNSSDMIQVRTGLYKRRVEYYQRDIGDFEHIVTFFSDVDTSKFGPFGFIGVPYTEQTGTTPSNESTALQVVLTNPDGKTFVQNFSSLNNTRVHPVMAGKSFDIAFDSISIAQLQQRNIEDNYFIGELYLPSLEVVYSGTKNNFNYGLGGGMWFQVEPTQAANVEDNTLGLEEPNVGGYLHTIANFNIQDVQFNEENQPVAVNSHIPFFDLDWNSSPNRLNTFQITTGYSFSRQQRNLGYAATGALVYTPQGTNGVISKNSNGEVIGVVNGKLGTQFGLGFNTDLEIGKKVYYNLELAQRVFQNFSLGVYHRNYTIDNIGLEVQVDDMAYGGIIRYTTPDETITINGELGNSDNGFDARIESIVKFNF